ncbi:MAG: membrane protein insertion efficiency factor YidD [Parachlamydiaceae bacterium]|nr:membrane protein insertion efficiency factor YidD [Parachlamydiaceae bacterium]
MKKLNRFLILSFLLTCAISAEVPWGKDATLTVKITPTCPSPKSSTFMTRFGERAIRFHQEVISPADGPRSHFIPSSSQYTLDAMRKYGFFRGYLLGCDRLMRENNDLWIYRKTWDASRKHQMKWDPVP